MGMPNYAKVATYEMLLKLPGITQLSGNPYTDPIAYPAYLDIPQSKWYYLRVNPDGTIDPQEYDPGKPKASGFYEGIDVFLGLIPKEVAKSLYFHLDLFNI